jgi:UDP-glucose 4-epimerase
MITGISRHLAARLAGRLEADPGVEAIVGVDVEEPELDLERTEFVHADIRNPLIAKTLQTAEIDTLIHLSIIATPTRVGGRSAMKEINVIGSLQLFAACQPGREVPRDPGDHDALAHRPSLPVCSPKLDAISGLKAKGVGGAAAVDRQ